MKHEDTCFIDLRWGHAGQYGTVVHSETNMSCLPGPALGPLTYLSGIALHAELGIYFNSPTAASV